MPANPNIVGYYVYSLVIIGVFLFNCRSWAFIRVTLLYFVCLTFFACLLIYGSAYSLESNLVQWHKEGWLATFPFTITGGAPDANTITQNNPAYWRYLISVLVFFVTFPQAVARGASLHLSKERQPQAVMDEVIKNYNKLQQALMWLKKPLPFVLGTVSNGYEIGEWIFVLLALSSLVSPFPRYNLTLMLFSCFFIVLLAGKAIANGTGLVSIILRLFIPGVLDTMQRFVVFVLRLAVYLLSLLIALSVGLGLYNFALNTFHTKSLNGFVIAIIVVIALGVLALGFTFLWKIITAPTKKLIEWMEIEVIDPV